MDPIPCCLPWTTFHGKRLIYTPEFNKFLWDNCHTGDVIVLKGMSFISNFVRFTSRSEWSHTGILVRPRKRNEPFYIWEASHETRYDEITKRMKAGVRLFNLKNKLARDRYEAEVAFVIFILKGKKSREIVNERIDNFMIKQSHKRYEHHIMELVAASTKIFENERNTTEFFCSELVVETLRTSGIIINAKRPPSNSYLPFDCYKGFINGDFTLNTEMTIKAKNVIKFF